MCTAQWGKGWAIFVHTPSLFLPLSLTLHCERSRRRLLGGLVWRGNPLLPPFSKAPYLNHCTLMFSYLKWSFFFFTMQKCVNILLHILCVEYLYEYTYESRNGAVSTSIKRGGWETLLGRYKLSISPKRQTLLYFYVHGKAIKIWNWKLEDLHLINKKKKKKVRIGWVFLWACVQT